MNLLWVYFLIGTLVGASIGVAVTGWIRDRADAKRCKEQLRELELSHLEYRVKRLELKDLDKYGI